MSDTRKYYVLCADNCKFESMTKEQILAAIAEATGATVTDVDSAFITKIKELNKGDALTIWRGTSAEYNALTEYDPNCYYVKTDDTSIDDINTAIKDLNEADVNLQNNINKVLDVRTTTERVYKAGYSDLGTLTVNKVGGIVNVTGVLEWQPDESMIGAGWVPYNIANPLFNSTQSEFVIPVAVECDDGYGTWASYSAIKLEKYWDTSNKKFIYRLHVRCDEAGGGTVSKVTLYVNYTYIE